MSSGPNTNKLDRYAEIGELAQRVRRLLKRFMILFLVLLGGTTMVLAFNGNPGAICFGLISLGTVIILAIWQSGGIGLPIVPLIAVQHLIVYGLPVLVRNEVITDYMPGQLNDAGFEVLVFSCCLAMSLAHGDADFPPRQGRLLRAPRFPEGQLQQAAHPRLRADHGRHPLPGPRAARYAPADLRAAAVRHGLADGAAGDRRKFLRLLPHLALRRRARPQRHEPPALLGAARAQLRHQRLRLPALRRDHHDRRGDDRPVLEHRQDPVALPHRGHRAARFLQYQQVSPCAGRYWSFDEGVRPVSTTLLDMPRIYLEWTEASIDAIANPESAADQARSGKVDENHQSLFQRVNNLQNLLFAINAIQVTGIPPLGGASYAVIPPLFVPRIMWEDKPRSHEGQVMLNVHFGRQDLGSTFRTYVAWGLLPEAYGNYGAFWGSFLLGCFLGVCFAWLENYTTHKLLLSLEGFVCFTILLCMVNSFEMVASVLVTMIYQAIIPIVFASMPFLRRMSITRPTAPAETETTG